MAQTAFQVLKQALTSTPTLALPNFNKPFIVERDASDDAICAVLTQQGKPLALMSRSLGPSKKSWFTYAWEMLAIVTALELATVFVGSEIFHSNGATQS